MRRTLIAELAPGALRRSSRICAWMVTSSAVVGSSAMRSFGSHASAIAIITRWRMPARELVRVGVDVRLGRRDADEAEQLDRARSRASRRDFFWCRRMASMICAAHRVDGVQARHRLLEDHRDRRCRGRRASRARGSASRSRPSSSIAPRLDAPRRGRARGAGSRAPSRSCRSRSRRRARPSCPRGTSNDTSSTARSDPVVGAEARDEVADATGAEPARPREHLRSTSA